MLRFLHAVTIALTGREQRALRRIETKLRRADPRIAGMLAIFNRLSCREEGPAAERLSPWCPRLSLVVAIAAAVVLVLALALGVILLSPAGKPHTGGSAALLFAL